MRTKEKKLTFYIIFLLFPVLLLGCDQVRKNDKSGLPDPFADDSLSAAYYVNERSFGSVGVAYKIDLRDGSIYVPCPDPLCSHLLNTRNSECLFSFFSPDQWIDTGRMMFISGLEIDKSTLSVVSSIYSYDIEENKYERLYEDAQLFPNGAFLLYGGGYLFFDIRSFREENGIIIEEPESTIIRLDLSTKETKEFGKRKEGTTVCFYDDGYIYYKDYSWQPYRTKGDMDCSEKVSPPPGHTFDYGDDYRLINNGLMFKQNYPSGIYLYKEERFLDMPVDCLITTPARTGDTIYFMTHENYTNAGDDPSNGKNDHDGYYNNELYILKTDGSYEHFTVNGDYYFSVFAGYGHGIIGHLHFAHIDGDDRDYFGMPIWIDLDSGHAILYNNDAPDIMEKPIDIVFGEADFTVIKRAD